MPNAATDNDVQLPTPWYRLRALARINQRRISLGGSVMRTALSRLLLMAALILLPASAFAQASIAGTTKDASGAVLPGVTVEAASPVLIEKVRTTVSDDRGLYRIVNLPPGTYVVTFSLQGFNVVKRDGVELSGSFTAQIDAEMGVGGLAETITVTGASPIVDVTS